MAQPPTYNRQASFVGALAAHPTAPFPVQSLDTEFNTVKTTLDATLTNLALIQRDDGQLRASAFSTALASAVSDASASATISSAAATSSTISATAAATSAASAASAAAAAVANPGAFSVTATGSTASRTLADRAAELLNVKNFGAKGDIKQRTAALTISLSTPTTMVLAGADFTSADIGKTILIPGVGAAGVQLVTTIAGVTSTTTITLGAAASTAKSAVSTAVVWGTDDSTSIQAAVTALRAATALTLANGTNATLYFPTGLYMIRTTINLTSIVGARVMGHSALLYGATAGKPIVDAMATYGTTVEGLALYGDRFSGPNVGWQLGRINSGLGAFGRNCYRSIVMYGYYSLCCFYKMASETSTFDFLNLTNSATNAYALIDDGCSHFGLTSDYVTVSLTADTSFTNTVATFNQCKMVAQGSGSNAMWIAAAASHSFNNCYWNSFASGVVIYNTSLIRSNDLHFSGTIEGPSLHNFYFDGTGSSALSGFSFTTCANVATTSTFANNALLTTMKLYDVDVHLATVATGVKVFNDPTIWQVSGHFGAAAVTDGWIPPGVFFGTVSINATSSTSYQSLVRTGPEADAGRARMVITGSHTIPNTTSWYAGIQTGVVAAATLTFPTPLNNGQLLRISSRGAITALTLTPQGGATIDGWTNPTAMSANTSLLFGWDSTSAAWNRLT